MPVKATLTASIVILVTPEQKQKWVDLAAKKEISLGELIRTSVEKEIGK